MTTVAIPAWTADGVLPPINAAQPVSTTRSPYVVSLTDYVRRFGDTEERRAILLGYLDFRAALHGAGITQGFQWLDGSFLEHVELTEGRPPRDLDLVTFYRMPAGKTQGDIVAAFPALTDRDQLKATFKVDAYMVDLGMSPERLTERSAYWYSLWSHRRNQLWKGFLQISLDPASDSTARASLSPGAIMGGAP